MVVASCSDMRVFLLLLLDFEVCKRVFLHHFEVCKKVYLPQRAFFPHHQREGDSIKEGFIPKELSTFHPPGWMMFSVTSGSLMTGWHLPQLLHLKVYFLLKVCRMAFFHHHHPGFCRKACSELELCKMACPCQEACRMAFYHHHYFQMAKWTELHFQKPQLLPEPENKDLW